MEKEVNLKEPRLEEYGLDSSSYESYRKQKKDLEKSLNECRYFPKQATGFYSFLAGLVGFSMLFGIYFVLFSLASEYFIQAIIYVVVFIILYHFNDLNDKELEKENEIIFSQIQAKRKEIEEKIQELKNKIFPFEEACSKYYLNYLESFYQNNLYKKRSGSEKFEQSTSEFSSMIDEVEEISKKLIFHHISWSKILTYKEYLKNRQIDHKYQVVKKFNSFNNVKVSTEEKPEQIKEISENLVLDSNKRIKDEFRKNVELKRIEDELREKVELERIEKEKILRTPPEKRFRTARKIDNWEEINKKRKETGDKGEEIVFLLEKAYFESINRKDLAEKVQHVSLEQGDGLGYDILSFFDNEKEKYIEVKSTTTSIESQFKFNISKNELKFLEEHKDDAFVYRVSLATEPPEVEIKPSSEILEGEITPTSFIIRVK